MVRFDKNATPEDITVVNIVKPELGSEAFNIENAMYFTGDGDLAQSGDELDTYFSYNFSPLLLADVQEGMRVVKFWMRNAGTYPVLSHVAFRVLATPQVSDESKSDFSAVSLMLNPCAIVLGFL